MNLQRAAHSAPVAERSITEARIGSAGAAFASFSAPFVHIAAIVTAAAGQSGRAAARPATEVLAAGGALRRSEL